ncbi:hypothetical protein JZO80_02740 [Vagococcus fluvialis]|uniref:hypothetical protein n=1 Tax=Vagococcus fluvialis TaxID=2738 RepID=UPI000A348BAA|nr:hypothetical protein [Vagococcus fluvialis]MBO0419066.1 hypothetical protein [Vagococcus fluvialis]OTP29488.1 hypothetical protein A5798_002656 [Enterococcus sp. 6C8_DIV0013]
MKEKTIKIIKILSEYSVVINAGANDGIQIGDKFDILSQEKRILEDPDTFEILDEFDSYKGTILAIDVRDRYSICETPKSTITNPTSIAMGALSETLTRSYLGTSTVQSKLNVSEYDIDNIFDKYNDDSPVVIGDHVLKIEKE